MIKTSLRSAKVFGIIGVSFLILPIVGLMISFTDGAARLIWFGWLIAAPAAMVGVIVSLLVASVVAVRQEEAPLSARVTILAAWFFSSFLSFAIGSLAKGFQSSNEPPSPTAQVYELAFFVLLAVGTILAGVAATWGRRKLASAPSSPRSTTVWMGVFVMMIAVFAQAWQVNSYGWQAQRAHYWEDRAFDAEHSGAAARATLCFKFEGANDLLDSVDTFVSDRVLPVVSSGSEVLRATDEARENLQEFDLNYCAQDVQHVREVLLSNGYEGLEGTRGELLSDPPSLRTLRLEPEPPEFHTHAFYQITPRVIEQMRDRANQAESVAQQVGEGLREERLDINSQGHDLIDSALKEVQAPLSIAAQEASQQVIEEEGIRGTSRAADMERASDLLGKVKPRKLLEELDSFEVLITSA